MVRWVEPLESLICNFTFKSVLHGFYARMWPGMSLTTRSNYMQQNTNLYKLRNYVYRCLVTCSDCLGRAACCLAVLVKATLWICPESSYCYPHTQVAAWEWDWCCSQSCMCWTCAIHVLICLDRSAMYWCTACVYLHTKTKWTAVYAKSSPA